MTMFKAATQVKGEYKSDSNNRKVLIQGYPGAFHEIAARYCFQPEEIEIVPAFSFKELVAGIESQQRASIGLMAIENTLAGSLMDNYELLDKSNVSITGEVHLRIKQNLMALPGQRIEDLKEVHSHPIALAQCRDFFANYPHIRLVEKADTALSALDIQKNQWKGVGAVASTLSAELYELEILATGIETNKKNHTRFLVLEPRAEADGEKDAEKISLSFSVNHESGSLYRVMAVLSAYHVNMTKIQSAPIIGHPWEYKFFVDFVMEGNVGFRNTIEAIRPLTNNLKILGVYDKGAHFEY